MAEQGSGERSNNAVFYGHLQDLAMTPSYEDREKTIRGVLTKKFEDIADKMLYDEKGNLYVIRHGGKPGSVMFSSHQDKTNCHDVVGHVIPHVEQVDSNLMMSSKASLEALLAGQCWTMGEDEYHRIKAITQGLKDPGKIKYLSIPVPPAGFYAPAQGNVRKNLIASNERFIPMGVNSSVTVEEGYLPIVFPYPIATDGKKIVGKLDDALGLSLILDLFMNTSREETPTLIGLFTTGEETGKSGARHAAKRVIGTAPNPDINPDKIIVIDTTRACKPGGGIVLYEHCDRMGGVAWSGNGNGNGTDWGKMNKTYQAPTHVPANSDSQSIPIDSSGCESGSIITKKQDNIIIAKEIDEEVLARGAKRGGTRGVKKTTPPLPPLSQRSKQARSPKKEPLVKEIEKAAKQHENTKLTTVQAHSNDSNVFASQTNVPTVALEIPLNRMHSPDEECAVSDVQMMRRFLKYYVSGDDGEE
jgi:putative aminopeptidase FrvX